MLFPYSIRPTFILSFFFFLLLSNFFLLFFSTLINNAYPLQGNGITEQSPTSIELLKKKETVEQPLSYTSERC